MRTRYPKNIIMEHFFVNPTKKMRIRQVERELGLSITSVIRYLRELVDEGILKRIEEGGVVFYAADRSSRKFVLEKRLFNIRSLYLSGLVDFIRDRYSNPTIVVFGSYAMGEDTEESDIDLYIESRSKMKIEFREFEKVLNRKIHAVIEPSISDMGNRHLANSILNGIVLNGFLEVFG